MTRHRRTDPRLDFRGIAQSALPHALALLRRWLPDGRVQGHEFICLNPKREDRSPGSFKINLVTGRWADFACGASGGDLISLAAYLFSIPMAEAAKRISVMLRGGQ